MTDDIGFSGTKRGTTTNIAPLSVKNNCTRPEVKEREATPDLHNWMGPLAAV